MLRTPVLALLMVFAGFAQAEVPQTHRDLDWAAPLRWVHIDNVAVDRFSVFETARLRWKETLRRDGVLLGDGRPLFWCARGDSVRTYFTLYPFRKWVDLDERSEMAKRTNGVVGEAAVKTYDAGDAALVPPHGSQLWRRQDAADIVCAATAALTELSAGTGRLERRQVDWVHWDEFETTWAAVQAALAAQQYPLACRVYANSYGGAQGDWVLLWLATDDGAYRAAPALDDALVKQLGPEQGARLAQALTRLFPVNASYLIDRRLDLSNLGE